MPSIGDTLSSRYVWIMVTGAFGAYEYSAFMVTMISAVPCASRIPMPASRIASRTASGIPMPRQFFTL
jgi:hypothetical protein